MDAGTQNTIKLTPTVQAADLFAMPFCPSASPKEAMLPYEILGLSCA
jgi:hypothetical protein